MDFDQAVDMAVSQSFQGIEISEEGDAVYFVFDSCEFEVLYDEEIEGIAVAFNKAVASH